MKPLDRGHELGRQRAVKCNRAKKDDDKNADRRARQPQNDLADFAAPVF
jgi:hypothetical protein